MSRTRHHRYKRKFVAMDKLKKFCELKRDKQGLQAGKMTELLTELMTEFQQIQEQKSKRKRNQDMYRERSF